MCPGSKVIQLICPKINRVLPWWYSSACIKFYSTALNSFRVIGRKPSPKKSTFCAVADEPDTRWRYKTIGFFSITYLIICENLAKIRSSVLKLSIGNQIYGRRKKKRKRKRKKKKRKKKKKNSYKTIKAFLSKCLN